MRLISRCRGISPSDWPAVIVTAITALAVELGVRVIRLPTLARLAGVPLAVSPPPFSGAPGSSGGGLPGATGPSDGGLAGATGPSDGGLPGAPGLTGVAGPTGGVSGLSAADRRRLRLCVQVMRHWPFDEKCLRRSLVCGHRIRHLKPQLVIGVAVVDGDVKAHAWVTVDGVSLDPSGSTTFLTLLPVTDSRLPVTDA